MNAVHEPDPLIVALGPILAHEPGEAVGLACSVDAAPWLEELTVTTPLAVTLTLQWVEEGILVRISELTLALRKSCDRCLTPFEHTCTVRGASVLFPLAVTSELDPDADIESRGLDLTRQTLDLKPVLRDFLLIESDKIRLCRPDCPGLCPSCGAILGTCTCVQPTDAEAPAPLSTLKTLWRDRDDA